MINPQFPELMFFPQVSHFPLNHFHLLFFGVTISTMLQKLWSLMYHDFPEFFTIPYLYYLVGLSLLILL